MAIETAEELKKQGNDCVKKEKFIEAMVYYTQAIKLDPKNHLLYSNRSLAFLKAQQFYHAQQDAVKVIEMMPNWSKGYFRKGEAEFQAQHYREALGSYQYGALMDPEDKGIREAISRTKKSLKDQEKHDKRIPMMGVAVGILVGVSILAADEVAADKPVLSNTLIKIVVFIAVTGLTYALSLSYRFLIRSQQASLLEPPLDLFPDEETENVGEPEEQQNTRKNHPKNAGARQRHRKSHT